MRRILVVLPLLAPLVFLLSACQSTGADTRPIVDNPGPRYERDLVACQNLSRQKDYANEDTATNAVAGAAGGAIIGGLIGDWTGAGIGAGVGTAAGLGKGVIDTQDARSGIVKKCLKNRGYAVLD